MQMAALMAILTPITNTNEHTSGRDQLPEGGALTISPVPYSISGLETKYQLF